MLEGVVDGVGDVAVIAVVEGDLNADDAKVGAAFVCVLVMEFVARARGTEVVLGCCGKVGDG